MVHLPNQIGGRGSLATFPPPSQRTFPLRPLYTVPEHETGSCSGQYPAQHFFSPLSTHSTPRVFHENQRLNPKDLPPSWTPFQNDESTGWFANMTQTAKNQCARRRAHRWIMSTQLALHLINFASSLAILALIAQALISHQKLRHIRQFSGADNAWPQKMSLAPSFLLLFAASTNVVKSAAFLAVEVLKGSKPSGNLYLFRIVSTACSVLMAAIWVPASVFVEINRQKTDSFTTWACARSDAAFNQIVPYRAICTEEVS